MNILNSLLLCMENYQYKNLAKILRIMLWTIFTETLVPCREMGFTEYFPEQLGKVDIILFTSQFSRSVKEHNVSVSLSVPKQLLQIFFLLNKLYFVTHNGWFLEYMKRM